MPDPKRHEVLRALNSIEIELLVTVLGTAVRREAACDLRLAQNPSLQDQLAVFVRGLSILYLYSFLESHVDTRQWKEIKAWNGAARSEMDAVNWDHFDIFKYVRDCFGHDWRGRMFPPNQNNTRRFLSLMSKVASPPDVQVVNECVVPGARAIDECRTVVESVLQKARLAADLG